MWQYPHWRLFVEWFWTHVVDSKRADFGASKNLSLELFIYGILWRPPPVILFQIDEGLALSKCPLHTWVYPEWISYRNYWNRGIEAIPCCFWLYFPRFQSWATEILCLWLYDDAYRYLLSPTGTICLNTRSTLPLLT